MSLNHFRALILAAGTVVTASADLAVLDAAFDTVSVTLVAFIGLLRATHVANVPQRGSRSITPAPRTYGLPTSMTSRH
jgi:hypothetical protein